MRTLRFGTRGPDVAAWQRFLDAQGLNPGDADGIFGNVTHAATVAFQQANGLVADGIVGPLTQRQAERLGFVAPPISDFATLFPVPLDEINEGLSAAKQRTMIDKFGRPGNLTVGCSDTTNDRLRDQTVLRNVGPFRVTGWRPAVEQLQEILAEAEGAIPEVIEQVQTAGMRCVRAVRGSTRNFSNHSWGTAVDIFFGSGVDTVNDGKTQFGLLKLAPFFNARRWYWGAGFSREDSMHFEMSDELIQDLDF